jgi:hypothetical protein
VEYSDLGSRRQGHSAVEQHVQVAVADTAQQVAAFDTIVSRGNAKPIAKPTVQRALIRSWLSSSYAQVADPMKC